MVKLGTDKADPAKRDDPLDRLKYIPLDDDGDIYLTLSGELRLRVNKAPGVRVFLISQDETATIISATASGTASITMAKQPACSRATASSATLIAC